MSIGLGANSRTKFYSIKEIALLLNVSPKTVYKWIYRKEKRSGQPLPVEHFGGCVRIHKEKFDKWAGLV